MLSIGAMGAGQGNYYLDLAREDYYLEGGEPPGRWYGQGAEVLGLTGEVEKQALRNLFLGVSPDQNRPLIQNAGDVDHQPGWDLTFSAPKSVSALWAVADFETRQVIQEAHHKAVTEALRYLQEDAAYTRRGKGGTAREPVGLIIATFEHGTSRTMDPQLHTHALILNVAMRRDGTSGTIESKPLYDHKMTAGALYRVELAAHLEKRLGLECERVRSWFEVKGVPKGLTEEFSKRRAEIEEFLTERGLTSASASAYANLATREVKGVASRSELFPKWQEVGASHGFTQTEIWHLLQERRARNQETEKANAVQTGLDTITEHESHFSGRDLLRAAAEAVQGRGVHAIEIRDAVKDALIHSKEIVSLGRVKGEIRYTTREILDIEKQMLTSLDGGRTDDHLTLPVQRVMETLSHKGELSEEQMKALWHITTHEGNVQVVSGMAGTGKTQMLSVAREAWEKEGYRVMGAALAGKAAEGLQEGAGIESHTIAKLLKELERGFDYEPDAKHILHAEFKHATWQIDGDTRKKMLGEYHTPTSELDHEWKYATWQLSAKQRDFLNYQLEREKYWLDAKTILVIDEAGMVGTRQMAQLIEAVQKAQGKIVLVGDAKQLQPVEAGGSFKAIGEAVGQAELKEIRRQREKWARDAVHSIAEGHAEDALFAYAERGLLTVTEDRREAMQAIVTDWKADKTAIHEKLILTGTNQEARIINQRIQEDRAETGELGKEQLAIGGETYRANDRILFTRNSKLYGVKNGSLGTLESLDRDNETLCVKLDNGDRRTIHTRHYEHLRLGYAVTTHKAQGVTAESVFVLAGGSMQNRELSYVQASRARGETRIYTDCVEAGDTITHLSNKMNHSRQKEIALAVQGRDIQAKDYTLPIDF